MVLPMMNQSLHVSILMNVQRHQIFAMQMLNVSINWAVMNVNATKDSVEMVSLVIQKIAILIQLNTPHHFRQRNVRMDFTMMKQIVPVLISMNAFNIRIYVMRMRTVSIVWAAMTVSVTVDFIEVEPYVIHNKPAKQRKIHHQPMNQHQAFPDWHPNIGYVISVQSMQTAIKVFVYAEMAGMVMALNVFTIARMIQFGILIVVYRSVQTLKKKKVRNYFDPLYSKKKIPKKFSQLIQQLKLHHSVIHKAVHAHLDMK